MSRAIVGRDSTTASRSRSCATPGCETRSNGFAFMRWARHVRFPHCATSGPGPTACATCHGDVSRMPQVFKVQKVDNMGFCINCHIERNVTRDCTACHY